MTLIGPELRDRMRREHTVRWIGVGLSMTALWAVGIYGFGRSNHDIKIAAERDRAAAVYAVATSRYENDRDERLACESMVSTRADLRGVLLGIFDAIDPEHDSETVLKLRLRLDADYPERTLAECPPIPVPPTLPNGG
jgi:hypothetical protein